jgi:hypothetical protein
MADSPQYTATLLDPCVAKRASAFEKIAAIASADTNRRAMVVGSESKAKSNSKAQY